MNLNEYLTKHRQGETSEFPRVPRITCKDGFSLSVQTNQGAYCQPRNNEGPWYMVEVGFPSDLPDGLMQYAEDAGDPTQTVYGYVPISEVEQLIENHGGIKE